jgi:hypothetical protein
MAHPTLPQLVHVPAEGTAPGTEALQSRPAGGASQSAAEAALGLVTVDILGLAGTGVPPAAQPINLLARRMFSTNIGEFWATGDSFCVVGVLALKTGNEPVVVTAVTWQQISPTTGPVTAFTSAGGNMGEWWSYQFLAWPSGTRLNIAASAPTATHILCTFSLIGGTGTVPQPGVRATGAGTYYSVGAPTGIGATLDFGWAAGLTLEPAPNPGQYNEDYGYPSGYITFASQRDTIAASGWTGQSAPAWTMTAVAVKVP